MGRLRLVRALVSAGALLGSVPAVAASACDPFLQDRPALLEQSLSLRGGERVTRTVRVPAQASALVLAREGDLDATLEVTAAGKVIGRADSPIHRRAIQRVAFISPQEADYTIVVLSREHAAASNTVELRVVTYSPAESKDSCLDVQQRLALADGSYAVGHWPNQKPESVPAAGATSPNALAVRQYAAVAALLAKSGASQLLAQTQHAQAMLYDYDISDWDQAVTQARAAASTYLQLHDLFGQARAQMIEVEADLERVSAPSASGQTRSGDRAAAFAALRERLNSIAAFHSARGERYQEAWALNNVGMSYYLGGHLVEAIPAFQRALSVFEKANEAPGQALALQNAAMMQYELGRLSEASAHYTRVLSLIEEEDDPRLYAIILNNKALIHWAQGELDPALREFNQALAILRVTQDPFVLAAALHNIGCVYDALGDRARALEFYQQALALRTAERDPRGRTASLRTIGNALREQGKAQEALKVHGEALALASAPGMKLRIEVQIAKDLVALDRLDEAAQRVDVVLREAGAGDELTKARALVERGALRASRGQPAPAEADLREAVRLFKKNEAPEDELDAWVQLAQQMRARNAPEEALKSLDRALALAEEVRMQSSNPELRATLLQPLRPAFDLKIELLAERYFAGATDQAARARAASAALATAEQARARALEDFRTFDVSAPGLPPELLAQRREVYRQLAARRFRLSSYLDRAGAEDPHVAVIRADIAGLRRQLDEIDARIGAASAANAQRSNGSERDALDLQLLPKDVAVIEYWLGAQHAYAWTATNEGVLMTKLGSSAAVGDAARSFHAALRAVGAVPEARRLDLAGQLYALVLAPLEPQIASRHRLVFAPDGALHYVPFATLRTAGPAAQFLVERHDLAITPSIGMYVKAAPRNAVAPARQMLLVADPVYDVSDARLGALASASTPARKPATSWLVFRGGEGERPLERLPGTAREAATIASLLPKESVDRLEGFSATRDRFLGAGLERYRFIHIASHAVNDAEVPQASALILSTVDQRSQPADGRVLAADFVNVQLNAETVVLSACDTALGKNVAGEGLIGLQYVVLARGAGSVVSSLWPVADQVTAQLMARFYAQRLRGHASMDAALSEAMRAMLAGPFKDPGLWGAFTLSVAHATGG